MTSILFIWVLSAGHMQLAATETFYSMEACQSAARAAVIALLADINRRYPGEGFKCPLILKLAEIVEHEPRN